MRGLGQRISNKKPPFFQTYYALPAVCGLLRRAQRQPPLFMYLNAHTYFSLRYGTLSPRQLAETAASLGISALVLTDINNTSAALDFVQACTSVGVKPLLGVEFREGKRAAWIGIARNNAGWQKLCACLTQSSLAEKPLPEVAPADWGDDVFAVYTAPPKPLAMLRPSEYIGIRIGQVPGLFSSPLRTFQHKLVVLHPITFTDREGYRLHKLLRAIDGNTLVTKLPAAELARENEVPLPEEQLARHFELYPEIIANTRNLLDHCHIHFETGLQRNRQSFTGSKEGDLKLLTKLALSGCTRRYGPAHARAQERIHKELKVIAQQDFGAYFLITWDIVRYAQSAGYYHIGRGSGANSIVAYCLFITDVDPLELDLYFERFINPRRTSPPDFDIDFSWDERDDVTDYIFKRYGREHTALLATYNTFQYAAAVRELGKAFGLQKSDIDYIVDNLNHLNEGSWVWRRHEPI